MTAIVAVQDNSPFVPERLHHHYCDINAEAAFGEMTVVVVESDCYNCRQHSFCRHPFRHRFGTEEPQQTSPDLTSRTTAAQSSVASSTCVGGTLKGPLQEPLKDPLKDPLKEPLKEP